ncbi:putative NFACT, RNA-binding domain-containing protein [Plasmopara halstedii]
MCGFIVSKDFEDAGETEMFEEFAPYLYAQHQHKKVKSFQTFDEAVDEYFSRYEAATAEVAKKSAQTAAENKFQDVENVLLVIRSALASGMEWRGLEELVRYEQKNVAFLLCDADEEVQDGLGGDGHGEEDKKAHIIWIDLSISALANAREIYTKKKKAGEKVKKATEATDKAIALAEKNTIKTLEKQQTKRKEIYQRRKALWFEKFHWFLSSGKYLVVAGKDAHQNELLVKRYLRNGDIFVHADLHGAATCIVRNHVTAKNKLTRDVLLTPVATQGV